MNDLLHDLSAVIGIVATDKVANSLTLKSMHIVTESTKSTRMKQRIMQLFSLSRDAYCVVGVGRLILPRNYPPCLMHNPLLWEYFVHPSLLHRFTFAPCLMHTPPV